MKIKTSKVSLSSIPQLSSWLWQAWKGHRLQALLNTLIGALVVLSDLTFVWATKLAIDIATKVNTSVQLPVAIGLLIGIILLQVSLGVASRWVRAVLGVKAQNHMRRRVFCGLLACRWRDLRDYHTGNLLNRVERDVSDVITFLTESVPLLANTCMKFVGAFVFLFIMDSKLACLILLLIPFFLVCSKLYVRKMRRLTRDIRDTESQVQATIQESLQHSLVVKTLEQTGNMVGKLNRLQERLHREVLGKTRYAVASSTIMNVGFATGYLVTFVWGVFSLQADIITYGTLIAFIQLVGQIQDPVRTLSRFVPVLITAFTATERLMELDRIPREEQKPPVRFPVGGAGLRLDHVTFSYLPTTRKILHDFSYDFPPGSITAVLGETGSGKTTLIRLILALLEPTEGEVALYSSAGGVAEKVSPATRCCFSYVPQGNTLLSGTIRDNLLMGNPAATEAEMTAALRAAAADFVELLPDGIYTVCGEMGGGLSEGQAQRISIARALLRRAPVLLFDEATSSLDAETEQNVIRNVVDMNGDGRTIIFVTHRPEVLKYATQVLRFS